MDFSLQLLRDTNPAGFAEAADAWSRLAAALDDGLDDYLTATGKLPTAWPSGTAAEQRTALLRAEIAHAHEPCQKISAALRTQADTIYRLQAVLADLLAECAGNGLTVDLATGVVSVKPGTVTDTAQAARMPGLMQGYSQQLTEVIVQATNVDAETRVTLQMCLPESGSGFGGGAGPAVSEADVAGQSGRPPVDVHTWWQSLTRSQQEQVMKDFPLLVGKLDGVPADDRNEANRHALEQQRLRVLEQLNSYGSWDAAPEELEKQLQSIYKIEDTLKKLGDRGYLLGFDTEAYSGDGKVIIAVGNPDTARHTGVWVPGLSTVLHGSMDGNIDRIVDINQAADVLTEGRGGDVSTVYWLDYDAPDLNNMSVVQNDRAESGRDPYLTFMQGLRATHEGDPGHLVAMGHSYGSTIVGEAAKTGYLPVDDIVVAGSPGMHVDNAGQLMRDTRHVWAGASDSDPVAAADNAQPWSNIAAGVAFGPAAPIILDRIEGDLDRVHGPAPTDAGFGGNTWVADTPGHTSYWEPDSDSLNNQARVLAGAYDNVTLTSGQAPENVR